MKGTAYAKALAKRQHQLSLLQHAYARQGRSAVIVLEGWDAAGKGGVIRRIAWALDPRTLRVWSIGAPSVEEQREHWIQRFWRRVPRGGEIAVFDRSWYGRVLVERVEGFAEEAAWRRAYDEINQFEQMLVDEGIRLVKVFLDIKPETQLERFRARYEDPAKRWKITEEDLRNRARWDDYVVAYHDMRELCSPPRAPWTRIAADDKQEARIATFDAILEAVGHDVDVAPPEVPALVKAFFDLR
ncbi:polyphosphate kinase [Thalassobaculum sp.]|uniref:polyphosphate kinase 2 family protein n=1 Tax=Thalassobaculum sp. TaxID=2022740 RepID=UPI0032EBF6F2